MASRRLSAEKYLKGNYTSSGKDWFTLATDPFHDYNHHVAGYPDADSSRTIVSCYQYAIDIAKPAGAAGNWDAHIFSLPLSRPETFAQYASTANEDTVQLTAGTKPAFAVMNVIAADAGQLLFPTTALWAPTNLAVTPLDTFAATLSGMSRLIGYGFEVVNTTAELNKQGVVTCYRMPQMAHSDHKLLTNVAGTAGYQIPTVRYRSPPSTVAEAMILGGSTQWAASDGCYCVVPLSNVSNPLKPASQQATMFATKGGIVTGEHVIHSDFATLGAANAMPVLSPADFVTQKHSPFCTSGAMFTGLSNSTTLRVKVKLYVERAPTFSEPDLAVLASPSATYDPKILNLYSSVIGLLPVAVPVGENTAGDWWRRILTAIAAVAPMVGSLIAPGSGTLIGTAVSGLAKAVHEVIPEKVSKKKKKSQPGPEVAPALNNVNRVVDGSQNDLLGKKSRRARGRRNKPVAPPPAP
nr:hypothetical protein [Sobelivirales sp.]